MASDFYNNAVFWIEVDRIQPNPFQPRKEFDPLALESLADSIRQYGVLQPLVVTRKEIERSDGGITVEYELVAGERRLRAAKLARIRQVPVLIRSAEDSDKMKLELAIIENLQREDLNPIDRALAFKQLADTFNLKHVEIAKKVGKSREYVSNSLRLLSLPEHIQRAVVAGEITEGHTRPLLMLADRPEQQQQLMDEIIAKKLTVREAERIARGIAVERARKQDLPPELAALERALTEHLKTRVQIETRENGGKVHIDFFTPDDITAILARIGAGVSTAQVQPKEQVAPKEGVAHVDKTQTTTTPSTTSPSPLALFVAEVVGDTSSDDLDDVIDDSTRTDIHHESEHNSPVVDECDEDLYSIKSFSL